MKDMEGEMGSLTEWTIVIPKLVMLEGAASRVCMYGTKDEKKQATFSKVFARP